MRGDARSSVRTRGRLPARGPGPAPAGIRDLQVRQPWARCRPMRGRFRERVPEGYTSAGTQGASGVPPQ